jgi:K+-sensing histidine kinase KdpD
MSTRFNDRVRQVAGNRDLLAVAAGLTGPLALSAVLVPFRASFPNTDAALTLLLVVVAVAASGSRAAGLLASASAAAWFDFFRTVPYERFAITRRDDIGTTLLLLAVGAAVTEIAGWGHRQHGAASRRAGYLDGINAAAKAVATGNEAGALIEQVCARLIVLLELRACRYEDGVAGIGSPPRLRRDGQVARLGRVYDDLPAGTSTELLVEAGGLLQGRFLLTAGNRTTTREQRLVAIAFADQAGAALAGTKLAGAWLAVRHQ